MANKKKEKNINRKIPVIKVEEKRETEKRDNQVKSLADYKPAIAKMYQDESGKPLNLSKLDKVKKSRKSLYFKIIGVLLLLFAISAAGFFVFFRDKKFKASDVVLTITASENVASGDETTLTIKYLNQGQSVLGNLDLTLTYPDGFTFKNAEPVPGNTYNQYWKLGNLGAGKGGEVKITGVIMGEVGATKAFTAKLSYKPSNFNSTFETESDFSATISSSIIGLEIEGTKRVMPDKEVFYNIKYKNDSSEPLEKIRILGIYPTGFTPTAADPNFSQGNNTWQIDRLEAGNSGQIVLKGKFGGQAGEMKELKIQVGLLDANETFSPQVEKSLLVLLVSPELTMEMKINGVSADAAVNLGDTLTYYLHYKNNSDIEIKDLSLATSLDEKLLDFSTLADDLKGKVKDSTLTWSKDQINGLVSLKPQDEGEITFRINLKSKLTLSSSEDKNYQLVNKFIARSSSLGDLGGNLEMNSNILTLKLNSQVSVSAEARYYSEENEALGLGPLPPQVGKTTAYRIFWYVTNTTNEVTNVSVTAILPADIYWTGQNKSLSAGELTFDPTSRQVTWTINKIPVGAGSILPQLSASFEVSTTPKAADVGLLKILTDKVSLQATDSFTNQTLKASFDSITSDLKNDINAQGKGQVIEAQP